MKDLITDIAVLLVTFSLLYLAIDGSIRTQQHPQPFYWVPQEWKEVFKR